MDSIVNLNIDNPANTQTWESLADIMADAPNLQSLIFKEDDEVYYFDVETAGSVYVSEA